MKKIIFKGVGTAIVTPMKEDFSINYSVFDNLLDMQIAGNADAVVVAGTTGESSTLTDDEHIELVRHAVKYVNGRIPVIAGAGSNNTAHAVYLSKNVKKQAPTRFSMLHHIIIKPHSRDYFCTFPNAPVQPVCLLFYTNVPSRTGVNIYPATYKRLSEIENIAAVKEASGNFSQMAKIANLCKEDLTIYSGNDDQITSSMALGGKV